MDEDRAAATLRRLAAATAGRDLPLAALDLGALAANAAALAGRAAGTPIRLATKSVRCRRVLADVLARPGYSGLMAYSLAEACWLARQGFADVLVGYPTADAAALRELAADPGLLAAITLMVDDEAQLAYLRRVAARPVAPVRVCLDVDASLRIGPLHLGVRRSPVRTPAQAAGLAATVLAAGDLALVGLMFYEAQLAGLPDGSPAVRWMKRRSAAELDVRRAAVVRAVRAAGARPEFVNSGGTGSLAYSAAGPAVTEVTAGSGLYHPALFDGYRSFTGEPALFFALPVVRRPARGIATAFGGGYVASGPAGASRLPRPAGGLRLLRGEGAGEVQTPVRGRDARGLRIGDAVWFRHAKAGELLERFDRVHLVAPDGTVTATVPSYRGEGRNFG
ncbi:MAG TPA: alanine racemase [Jatrophihabitans sp.]|nr:alanine racemase [Jatrophihabitans sp.]